MEKQKSAARTFIMSVRVTREEMKQVNLLAEERKETVSQLIRDALTAAEILPAAPCLVDDDHVRPPQKVPRELVMGQYRGMSTMILGSTKPAS